MILENPELWLAAAGGCPEAQRQVSMNAHAAALSGERPREEGLIVAETMARLSIALENPNSYAWLACVLLQRAEDARRGDDDQADFVFEVEAAALMTFAADMGDTDCLQLLARHGHSFRPETIEIVARNQPLIFTLTSPAGSA